ncbi:MAG TPA: O-antigen ligase family protein [Thermomicrobiales bacterium]
MRDWTRLRIWKRLPAVATSTIASLATAVFGQGTLLVSGILAARMLGPEDRGHFALVTLIPLVICQVGLLGVEDAVTYFIARDRRATRAIVGVAFPPALLQVILCSAAQVLVVGFLIRGDSREVQLARLVTLVVPPAVVIENYGLAILQGMRLFRPFNILRLMQPFLYAVGLPLALVLAADRLPVVAVIWSVTHVVTAVVIVLATARAVSADEPEMTVPSRGEIVGFGAKGFLGSVSPLETFRLDQAVVGLFLSPVALGIYVASLAFTNLPRLIAFSIGMVALPHVAGQPNDRLARRSMWRFVWLTVGSSVVIVVVLGLAAPILVPFLLGDEFRGAVTPMRILLIGAVPSAARRVLGDGLRGRGYPSANTIAEIASWGCTLPALALLVPWLQLNGVAIALVGSSIVSLGVLLLFAVAAKDADEATIVAPAPRSLARRFRPALPGDWRVVQRLMLVAAVLVGASVVGWLATVKVEIVAVLAGLLAVLLARHQVPRLLAPTSAAVSPIANPGDVIDQRPTLMLPRAFYYVGAVLITGLVLRVTSFATLSDWFFLASLLSAVAIQLLHGKLSFSGLPQGLMIGLAIFASGAFISSLNAASPLASIAVLLRFVYLMVSWFWLGALLLKTPRHVKTAIVCWAASAALSGMASLAQLRFGDVIPGTSPAWGRMTGLAYHYNDLGSSAAVAVVPALIVPSLLATRLQKLVGAIVFLPLIAAGLILSGSVGAMTATSVGILLWLVMGRLGPKSILIGLVAGLSILLLLTLQQDAGAPSPLQRLHGTTNTNSQNCSVCERIVTYHAAWDAIGRSPFIGAGMTTVTATGSEVHNMLLGAWFEAGLLGLIGMVVILVSVGLTGIGAVRGARSREEWVICLALLTSFVCFVVVGMATPILFQRFGWMSTGLLLAMRRQQVVQTAGATAQAVPTGVPRSMHRPPRREGQPRTAFAIASMRGEISR